VSDLVERLHLLMDDWEVLEAREDWWKWQKDVAEAADALEAKDALIADLVDALNAFMRANDGIPDYNLMPMEIEARAMAKIALSKAKAAQS
jgi:hypothetical protein